MSRCLRALALQVAMVFGCAKNVLALSVKKGTVFPWPMSKQLTSNCARSVEDTVFLMAFRNPLAVSSVALSSALFLLMLWSLRMMLLAMLNVFVCCCHRCWCF